MRKERRSNKNVSGKSQASSKRRRYESCAEHGVPVVANRSVCQCGGKGCCPTGLI